jgi:hypothetical protein
MIFIVSRNHQAGLGPVDGLDADRLLGSLERFG